MSVTQFPYCDAYIQVLHSKEITDNTFVFIDHCFINDNNILIYNAPDSVDCGVRRSLCNIIVQVVH